jgi:hypothetical protein
METMIFGGVARVIGRGELAMTASRQIVALGVVGVILSVGFLLVVRPVFWAPSEPAAGRTPMTRRRVLVVYGLMAFIFGGSLLDCVRDTEHWPWSCYPMYSYPETATTFDDYRLYGVPRENPDTEISLFLDERYLQPFDQSRLSLVLEESLWNPRLREGLENCLTRYEALRRGGRHEGPELVKLRMYHAFWTLDPTGANIEKPDRKELIEEVALPQTEKS